MYAAIGKTSGRSGKTINFKCCILSLALYMYMYMYMTHDTEI